MAYLLVAIDRPLALFSQVHNRLHNLQHRERDGMADYYAALKAIWPSVAGATTDEKLAALNAMTVAGPSIDVPVSRVIGQLALWGLIPSLKILAATPLTGDAAHDAPIGVANTLFSILGVVETFEMSDPVVSAEVAGMMDVLVSAEKLTADQKAALMALSNSPPVPWWQANGYARAFDMGDITTAGLS